MPIFAYKVITETGDVSAGTIEADTKDAANSKLTAQGYIPTQVREVAASAGVDFQAIKDSLTPIKVPEIILFTKQFRTMIRAGVSMLNLLSILEDQTENVKLKKVISSMHQSINQGASLTEAFQQHPRVFSPLYCSMVQAGETSGALPEILQRLTYILEHEQKVKTDISYQSCRDISLRLKPDTRDEGIARWRRWTESERI